MDKTTTLKQKTDLELCLEFKAIVVETDKDKKRKDKVFEELMSRYQSYVWKLSAVYFGNHPVIKMCSMEIEDVFCELSLCVQKAMNYVNLEKIPKQEFFNFSYLLKQFADSWLGDLYRYANANKRKVSTTTDYCDQEDWKTFSVEDNLDLKIEKLKFLDSLEPKEMSLLHDLLDNKSEFKIKKIYGKKLNYLKRSIQKKYSKFAKTHLTIMDQDKFEELFKTKERAEKSE